MVQLDIAGISKSAQQANGCATQHFVASLSVALRVHDTSVSLANGDSLFGPPQAQLLIVAEGIDTKTKAAVDGDSQNDGTPSLVESAAIDRVARSLMRDDRLISSLSQGETLQATASMVSALQEASETINAFPTAPNVRASEGQATPPWVAMTAAIVAWPHVMITHAGDSAAVLVREDQATLLTTPHTATSKLTGSGFPIADPEEVTPLDRVVVNALGSSDKVSNLRIETYSEELQANDVLILGTSGLPDSLDWAEVAKLTRQEPGSASQISQRLAEEALAAKQPKSAVSIVVAKTTDASELVPLSADTQASSDPKKSGEGTTNAENPATMPTAGQSTLPIKPLSAPVGRSYA